MHMSGQPLARIFTESIKSFDFGAFRIEGYRVEPTPGFSYQPCDLAVVYGMPNASRSSEKMLLRNDVFARHAGRVLVTESCIVGRVYTPVKRRLVDRFWGRYPKARSFHPFLRLSLNAAFGPEADFNNKGSPPDRWEQLGIAIRPYRTSGDHVLLIGQKPGDSSLRGVNVMDWLIEKAAQIRRLTTRPILVRFHPSMASTEAEKLQLERVQDLTVAPHGQPMSDSLANAWVTVTLSSGAAIDSMIAGVPAITLSPDSLAYELTSHDVNDIDHPPEPPREQWLYDLAYAQWSPEEYADGTAWRHISPAVARATAAHVPTELRRQVGAGRFS